MGTWRKRFGRRLLSAVAAGAILATAQPVLADGPKITRIPATNFEWPAGVPRSPASFVVRPATLDEQAAVRESLKTSNYMLAASLGISAAGVAEAAALGGMFAGGLVAGAVVLVPLSLGLYVHDRIIASHIREVLDVEVFLADIREGLPSDPPLSPAPVEVDVRILDFGLVPRDANATDPTNPLCLVADAEIVVRHAGESLYDELLYLQPYLRSAGAPAPSCRSYALWGEREAALLVAARRDLARSLAGMVVSRLQPLVRSD